MFFSNKLRHGWAGTVAAFGVNQKSLIQCVIQGTLYRVKVVIWGIFIFWNEDLVEN